MLRPRLCPASKRLQTLVFCLFFAHTFGKLPSKSLPLQAGVVPDGALPPEDAAAFIAANRDELRAAVAFCSMATEAYSTVMANHSSYFSTPDEVTLPVYGYFPEVREFRGLWSNPFLHDHASGAAGLPQCHFYGTFTNASRPVHHTYIAFIGSKTARDWLTNMQAFVSPEGAVGVGSVPVPLAAHKGFADRAAGIPILSIIEALNNGHRVTLCGHSLGGAVASLVTHRVLAHPVLKHDATLGERLRCITFGAPLFLTDLETFHRPAFFTHVAREEDIVVVAPALAHAAVTKLFTPRGLLDHIVGVFTGGGPPDDTSTLDAVLDTFSDSAAAAARAALAAGIRTLATLASPPYVAVGTFVFIKTTLEEAVAPGERPPANAPEVVRQDGDKMVVDARLRTVTRFERLMESHPALAVRSHMLSGYVLALQACGVIAPAVLVADPKTNVSNLAAAHPWNVEREGGCLQRTHSGVVQRVAHAPICAPLRVISGRRNGHHTGRRRLARK